MKLIDKCSSCGKVAKATSTKELKVGTKIRLITNLECGHTIIQNLSDSSPFEELTFDGDEICEHEWNRTICIECGAKRLFPFQIEGARELEKHNGNFAIFDEMGLGKTIQALAYLKYHPEMRPFIWVTKAGTIFQHGKEIVRLLGSDNMPWVLQSGKDKPMSNMNCLASYDIFRRLKPELFDNFKIVILDECQAIKNPTSTRTQVIRQLIQGPFNKEKKEYPKKKKVIPLSGTPWKNRGSEFFVVLNLLDSKQFNSFESFKNRYVDHYYEGAREREGGLIDPIEFRKLTSHIAIRRERKDVMPELPLINRTEIKCQVPEYARAVYKQEEDKLLAIMKDMAIDDTNTFVQNAQIMQSLLVMKQVIGIAKVDSTVEYIKDFLTETDRKLVCFVHHKQCAELIMGQISKFCEEEKLSMPLRISADMNAEQRFIAAEKFNSKEFRFMVASTLASGEGLNLQTCSDCIMHERQWNPANEEQAEGRFIRIGQKSQSVNAIYVHGEDTIDTILHKIVEKKRIAFHNSMNTGTINSWSESNIISELLEGIKKSRKK